jgi:hypothetical protein
MAVLASPGSQARAQGAARGIEQRAPRPGTLAPWKSAPRAGAIPTGHTAAELYLARSLERGTRAAALRRALDAPLGAIRYGVRSEPLLQFQMKRELLLLLARVTGESRLTRAAMSLRPTSSLRGIEEGLALEGSRVRATYVAIEELLAPREMVTSMSTHAAFASSGALLFGSAIAAQKLLHGALGDRLSIYPLPWPTGFSISGRFRAL